jgi:CTP synthase
LHMAVIEAARDLAGLDGAGTTEIGTPKHAVIGLMTEWTKGNQVESRAADGDMGGTMRLGAYPATLTPGSRVAEVYGTTEISERHRHRYEVNTNYAKDLSKYGMEVSGWSPDGRLPEIMEIPNHPWFIGVQFHPELKSRPLEPHPLFTSFIAAAVQKSRLV